MSRDREGADPSLAMRWRRPPSQDLGPLPHCRGPVLLDRCSSATKETAMYIKPVVQKLFDRRGFLKSFGSAAAAFGAAVAITDEELEAYPQNMQRNSKPSDLRITDLRVATVARAPMTCPLIRIHTNPGIYGLGKA